MATISFPQLPHVDMTTFDLSPVTTVPIVIDTSTKLVFDFGFGTWTFTGTGLQPVVHNGMLTGMNGGTLISAEFSSAGTVGSEILNWSVSALSPRMPIPLPISAIGPTISR